MEAIPTFGFCPVELWCRELSEKSPVDNLMRTDRYRLILWRYRRDAKAYPLAAELFAYQSDPDENQNIASANQTLMKRLTHQHDGRSKAVRIQPATQADRKR